VLGSFSRLLGGSEEPVAASHQPIAIGAGWRDIEVEGEAYRRAEIVRLFNGIGRNKGGVTMQQAPLIPEPSNQFDRNAVKVVIRGNHVGYVPADFSARVASACRCPEAAERDARDASKLARRAAGTVRGEYWPTWKPSITELKRQQRLDEARAGVC